MSKIIMASECKEDPAYQQLREDHNIETYDDYAGILKKMSKSVSEMLEDEGKEIGEMDSVERSNLKTLKELLALCSDLFIDCDPYYRR